MIREGKFDVVIAAGPRVSTWPSVGARALSTFCAKQGLSVGVFGGDSVSVKGVIPLPGAGAWVLAQDVQGRIHRIRARSVVRVAATAALPDPFPGWYSPGLIPLNTARRLWNSGSVTWEPGTAILGTGNAALRFGSQLLEAGNRDVVCVESSPQWGAKRFSGWEVEKRRFEMAGGVLLEAMPQSLKALGPLVWEACFKDSQGTRRYEVSRVVSAGPFRDLPSVREYPPGSLLFELDQTSGDTREEDPDGWAQEEERGRWIACRIVKALSSELGDRRDEVDHVLRRSRSRLKKFNKHLQEPFTPAFQGKWLAPADMRRIREFAGVPREQHGARMLASVECLEGISCTRCHEICPEQAIGPDRTLDERKCTGCGVCVEFCPAGAIAMVHQPDEKSSANLVLPWRGRRDWRHGELATVLNRRGEVLGSGRVLPEEEQPWFVGRKPNAPSRLLALEVPSHLVWEARAVRAPKASSAEDESFLASVAHADQQDEKVDVMINGEKRRVRREVSVSTALFELGLARARDVLHCTDGSCGLCEVTVDGITKLGCQTEIHRGMAIQLPEIQNLTRRKQEQPETAALCPCQGITEEQVLARIKQGKLRSPEAALAITHVGEGKCRGQRCADPFKRLLKSQGMDLANWVDWRFPWSEWTLPGS